VFEWDPRKAEANAVLMVVYPLRRRGDAEAIRIISASRRERAAYASKD